MNKSKLVFYIPCVMEQLNLKITLQCGQSFRWKESKEGEWTGMINGTVLGLSQTDEKIKCVVHNPRELSQIATQKDLKCDELIQNSSKRKKANSDEHRKKFKSDSISEVTDNDTKTDLPDNTEHYLKMVKSYFRLEEDLCALYDDWSKRDENFAKVSPMFPGIRMLDQPPVENVFSFICSSNNNIKRISQLVEKLCVNFGEKACDVDGYSWHSFPDVAHLSGEDVEERLRALAFGYRASYIVKSARLIASNGGAAWLEGLAALEYPDTKKQLCTLPGVGPKVSDCICLMSMSHLAVVPVDTHVFQICARVYLPVLQKHKTVTDGVYKQVQNFFKELHGEYAGWAHSILFTADLKQFADGKETKEEKSSSKKKEKSVKTSKKKKPAT